jgi:uncharacterized protein (TIGR02118 family)
MIKLIALFKKPSEVEVFDRHYENIHLPLVRNLPGIRELEVTRVVGAPIGESRFHVMAELYFDNKDAMDAALASPEGKALAKDLLHFAANVVTVFYGETAD